MRAFAPQRPYGFRAPVRLPRDAAHRPRATGPRPSTRRSGRLDSDDIELLREDLTGLLYERTRDGAEYVFGDGAAALQYPLGIPGGDLPYGTRSRVVRPDHHPDRLPGPHVVLVEVLQEAARRRNARCRRSCRRP
ncbi:hypothetical protein [Streptomyces sp. NPDC005970]|uniref:hypothetical protein n=1 Tax=Streptomyces sp. NPDC005970 TaxID=3156723 RepID=UPI0033C6C371